MARIAVIGGTGYAGRNIVAEAVSRGHTVVSVARTVPAERVEGATYIEGTLLDSPSLATELQGVDVVVSTVPARGDMVGSVRPDVARAGRVASARCAHRRDRRRRRQPRRRRRPAAGRSRRRSPRSTSPRRSRRSASSRTSKTTDTSRDWFYVHPAGGFGAWNPGERTGSYRVGGDVVVTDAEGESYISGPDLGVAVVDEIENPKHSRERFTVGY